MALEILSGRGLLFRRPETDAMITMPVFAPQRVCPPYDFDITRSQQGYWIACDRGGLTGGTFLNREDAVHFALFEDRRQQRPCSHISGTEGCAKSETALQVKAPTS